MRKYIILFLLCGFIGKAQYNLFARQNFAKGAISAYDADAQAFIAAAGLTDTTQKNALNQLVLDLKSYGLWVKMKAIYPIIGGTAFTHKWNLKDPRDLDIAFRITYDGMPTHSSAGVNGNGVSRMITNLNSLIILTASDNHLSNYCTTDSNGQIIDIGQGNHSLYQRFLNVAYSDNPASNRISVANATSKGMYVSSRISTTSHKLYKNGTVIQSSSTTTASALDNFKIYLLGQGNSVLYYSDRTYCFFSIGNGLTDTDASNLYTSVQAYQTTLGRQVP